MRETYAILSLPSIVQHFQEVPSALWMMRHALHSDTYLVSCVQFVPLGEQLLPQAELLLQEATLSEEASKKVYLSNIFQYNRF